MLATGIQSVSEVIMDGQHRPPGTPSRREAAGEALLRLLGTPEFGERIRREAQTASEQRLDSQLWISSFEDFYRRLADRGR